MGLTIAVGIALVAGWLAGLLSFKIKQRWCTICGATLTCPDPTYHVDQIPGRRFHR